LSAARGGRGGQSLAFLGGAADRGVDTVGAASSTAALAALALIRIACIVGNGHDDP